MIQWCKLLPCRWLGVHTSSSSTVGWVQLIYKAVYIWICSSSSVSVSSIQYYSWVWSVHNNKKKKLFEKTSFCMIYKLFSSWGPKLVPTRNTHTHICAHTPTHTHTYTHRCIYTHKHTSIHSLTLSLSKKMKMKNNVAIIVFCKEHFCSALFAWSVFLSDSGSLSEIRLIIVDNQLLMSQSVNELLMGWF